MNVLKVKKGETLARKKDKVMEWYLIQEGSVIRQFAFAEIIMHRNELWVFSRTNGLPAIMWQMKIRH